MRVEVLGGPKRRRRWRFEDKARLVAQTFEPGVSVCAVARQNGIAPGLLFTWRRQSSVLKPDLLEKLKARLLNPPPDGGLWTSPKVAAWMAGELGLAEVLPQRGWEALKAIGWSVQKPRPRHPASATPEEREAFKKSWSRLSPRSGASTRTRKSKSGRPTSTASG